MSEKKHPGINMHKLSFGGGLEGLTFVIGSTLIFVFGLPALWYFVALAYALGVGVAILLRMSSNRRAERNKPLSIMAAEQTTVTRSPRPRQKWHKLFFVVPRVSAT